MNSDKLYSSDSSKSSNNVFQLYFKITNKEENHHGFQSNYISGKIPAQTHSS